ncbi:MAG: CoA-binding protein [Natronomonas sp.]
MLERDDVEVVWTQLGIRDSEAGERVEDSGRKYVEDKCLKVVYNRLK